MNTSSEYFLIYGTNEIKKTAHFHMLKVFKTTKNATNTNYTPQFPQLNSQIWKKLFYSF